VQVGAIKERFQNPVVGDTVNLRLFTYNSNNRSDFQNVQQVDIYFLDPDARTEANPHGRTFVLTIPTEQIVHTDVGLYQVALPLTTPAFTIGKYIDVWSVSVDDNEAPATVENSFQIFPDLWFTSPIPIVYDFSFVFRPNKIRVGSKKWIIIEITPNVPQTSDLKRYYEQLAIVSPLNISMEQACGDCLPPENDLRIVLDNVPVELREKGLGYFFLDATELDPGIYNVWFTMAFGESYHVSDKQQLQLF
jgi:hypothetical protein